MKSADLRLMRLVLATIWIVTGVLSLYTKQDGMNLLGRVGLHGFPALAVLYLAAVLDIVLGLLTLMRGRKWLWRAQAFLIIAYTVIIAIRLPEFLVHPFGPVLKNLPILLMVWLLHKNEHYMA